MLSLRDLSHSCTLTQRWKRWAKVFSSLRDVLVSVLYPGLEFILSVVEGSWAAIFRSFGAGIGAIHGVCVFANDIFAADRGPRADDLTNDQRRTTNDVVF